MIGLDPGLKLYVTILRRVNEENKWEIYFQDQSCAKWAVSVSLYGQPQKRVLQRLIDLAMGSMGTQNLSYSSGEGLTSEEAAVLQVVLDDDVGDGVKHKLHVLGVGGTGEVGVDLLGVLLLVQVLELGLDVVLRLLVLVGAWRVRDGRRSEKGLQTIGLHGQDSPMETHWRVPKVKTT